MTATWKCRSQRLAMNGCMVAHATLEEQDAARREWIMTRLAERREREDKERCRKEAEAAAASGGGGTEVQAHTPGSGSSDGKSG